jgi:hypothetical protein
MSPTTIAMIVLVLGIAYNLRSMYKTRETSAIFKGAMDAHSRTLDCLKARDLEGTRACMRDLERLALLLPDNWRPHLELNLVVLRQLVYLQELDQSIKPE